MMDYTELIDDFINTREFKDFLKITGGKVISTSRQAAGCTVQVGTLEQHKAWGFFANGYVRESFYGILPYSRTKKIEVDSQSNIIRKPEKDVEVETNLDLYLSGLKLILSRFDKRDIQAENRAKRLNENRKVQQLAVVFIFDPTRLEKRIQMWDIDKGKSYRWEQFDNGENIIKHGTFDNIIKNYIGKVDFIKDYRIK